MGESGDGTRSKYNDEICDMSCIPRLENGREKKWGDRNSVTVKLVEHCCRRIELLTENINVR